MGDPVNGIEPCARSEEAGLQCMCGIEIDVVAGKKIPDGVIPNARCRLCTGLSDHDRLIISRQGQPWGVIVCNVCLLVCEEY